MNRNEAYTRLSEVTSLTPSQRAAIVNALTDTKPADLPDDFRSGVVKSDLETAEIVQPQVPRYHDGMAAMVGDWVQRRRYGIEQCDWNLGFAPMPVSRIDNELNPGAIQVVSEPVRWWDAEKFQLISRAPQEPPIPGPGGEAYQVEITPGAPPDGCEECGIPADDGSCEECGAAPDQKHKATCYFAADDDEYAPGLRDADPDPDLDESVDDMEADWRRIARLAVHVAALHAVASTPGTVIGPMPPVGMADSYTTWSEFVADRAARLADAYLRRIGE